MRMTTLRKVGMKTTVRLPLSLYNNIADIDALVVGFILLKSRSDNNQHYARECLSAMFDQAPPSRS
jgi:hypothetical protein